MGQFLIACKATRQWEERHIYSMKGFYFLTAFAEKDVQDILLSLNGKNRKHFSKSFQFYLQITKTTLTVLCCCQLRKNPQASAT